MSSSIPASWLQEAVIEHLKTIVADQVVPTADGNEVSVVPVRVRPDGSLLIIWTWTPRGPTRLSEVRRGEVTYTPSEAVQIYASYLKRASVRRKTSN